MSTSHGNINAGTLNSYAADGDSGSIDLRAGNSIKTGAASTVTSNGKAGSITYRSIEGGIEAGYIETFAIGNGDSGNVTLEAFGDISLAGRIASGAPSEFKGGEIKVTSSNGKIDTSGEDINSISWYGLGGAIALEAKNDIAVGAVYNTSQQNAGNIGLKSNAGNIKAKWLRSDSSQGTGGDITIDAGKFVKVTGSENIDDIDYSIYTNSVGAGSITTKHGGATNTPFTVGDASVNGTKEAISTGTSGILPITDTYIFPGSFELGNIKLIDSSDINGSSGTDILLGGNTTVPTAEELSQLEQRFRKLVQFGRDKGYPVAARNLEKFLDGSGETEIIDKSWLRQFPSISGSSVLQTGAEKRLQNYFKGDINAFSTNTPINDTNQTMVVPLGTTYWDADIVSVSPAFEAELYYASGKSNIKATGQFRMEIPPQGSSAPRKIIGNIHYHWYDNYAFIQGEDVLVPFAGWWGIFPERFTDEDAIKMKTYGRARSFDMVADWDQFVYAESSIFGGWNINFGTI